MMNLVHSANTLNAIAKATDEFARSLDRDYGGTNRHSQKYFDDLAQAQTKLEVNLRKARGALASHNAMMIADSAIPGSEAKKVFRIAPPNSAITYRANHFQRFTRKLKAIDLLIAKSASGNVESLVRSTQSAVERTADPSCFTGLTHWQGYLGEHVSPESSVGTNEVEENPAATDRRSAAFRPSTWYKSLHARLDEIAATADEVTETPEDSTKVVPEEYKRLSLFTNKHLASVLPKRPKIVHRSGAAADTSMTAVCEDALDGELAEVTSIHSFSVKPVVYAEKGKGRNALSSLVRTFSRKRPQSGTIKSSVSPSKDDATPPLIVDQCIAVPEDGPVSDVPTEEIAEAEPGSEEPSAA